ncbi:MAG: DUF1684 domain-containing protein [Cyclobacteriaceae bacterium]
MRKLLFIIVPVSLLAIIGYTLNNDSRDQNYINKVADIRAERIRFLKSSDQSPFIQHDMKYGPLSFYPINEEYKVRANLERIGTPSRVQISNSDGTKATYLKFAYAKFSLDDQPLKLLILKPTGFGVLPNTYFTAFADKTSGTETYGAGRYLDLEIGKSDNIIIDFNLAYNPYCAYTSKYTCPLPPTENLLPVSIMAGEKDYNY